MNHIKNIRRAVADYMQSEGCGCCRSSRHDQDKAALAKLLRVPKYKDGSGYDFSRFQSDKQKHSNGSENSRG